MRSSSFVFEGVLHLEVDETNEDDEDDEDDNDDNDFDNGFAFAGCTSVDGSKRFVNCCCGFDDGSDGEFAFANEGGDVC